MSGISEPQVSLSIIPAAQLAGVTEQKVLIVGQKTTAGSATGGDLIQSIPNDNSEDALFGKTSILASMVREFKKINKVSQLDVLPLVDGPAGTLSNVTIIFTGTATSNGTLVVSIGSENDHSYKLDIVSGDTATIIGDKLVTAITNDTTSPFSNGINTSGSVSIDSVHVGTISNSWTVKIIDNAPGVTVTTAGWSGGTSDPTLTGILSVITNIRYQTIVWPEVYTLTEVQTDLDNKFNLSNDIKDGVAIQSQNGTLATLKSSASTPNSQYVAMIGNKTVSKTLHKGTSIVEFPDVISSRFSAIRSLRLSQGAPLTDILTTVSPTDQFGGIHIASLPYHNTKVPNTAVPDPDTFFTQSDLSEFKTSGVAIFGPNQAFNNVILGDIVTTYLTDTAGNPDTSYRFLNTVDTSSVIREFFFTNYKKRYAQSRLTTGDLRAGFDIVNEGSFRSFSNRLYDELADVSLVQSGRSAKKDFDDNMMITVDIANGSITVNMAPLLVTQVRTILGTIQVNFGN